MEYIIIGVLHSNINILLLTLKNKFNGYYRKNI